MGLLTFDPENSMGSPLALFGSMLVSFGCLLGIFRVPLDPFGYPLDHFGTTLAVLGPPLGTILDDCCIIVGPSDYRKGPKGDEERLWDDLLLMFEDIR